MKKEVHKTEADSKYIGVLPLGCQLCIRGQKLVFFIGGKCNKPPLCSWYCPISLKRRGSEQMYANEIEINTPKDVFREVEKSQAQGCSFTGGDPLGSEDHIELSLFYIEELKRKYSDNFHIHLYTNGKNLTRKLANELAEVGLDEIRFHLDEEDFHKIDYAMDLGIEVGAEVPVIPTSEHEEYIWNLMDYLDTIGALFINLNEFEMNEPNQKALKKRGFQLAENSMSAVKGSRELAQKILNNIPDRYNLSVHYCPVSLKDGPQQRNRYKLRAESIKRNFEEITEDGTLIFIRVKGEKKNLQSYYKELTRDSGVPKDMMELNLKMKEPFLDMPWFLSEDSAFLEGLEAFDLEGGIMEILPFRGKYFDLCEYTPL
ncbi:MAG: radical SAM protein [Candidatus Lokiarchaeota archaeon]|nr:radical SAM protein [Candidatus Lokiarchaeota archaeon]